MFGGVVLFSDYVDNRNTYVDSKTGEATKGSVINGGMLQYIGTREGVELNGENNYELNPSTQYIKPTIKQNELIEELTKAYPELKKLECFDMLQDNPSLLSASSFITEATDLISEMRLGESNKIYLNYIGTRPNVEMSEGKNHGLFSFEDNVELKALKKEVEGHEGVVWRHIFSLSRDQAIETEFDNQKAWKNLLQSESLRIGKEMNIRSENLRWVAAFHDEGHHPHVHMMVWSKDTKEGFLDRKGIEKIRSIVTNDIFGHRLDLIHDIQQEEREEIMGLFKGIKKDQQLIENLKEPLLDLARALPSKGRMYYGYMPQDVKEKVNVIVHQIVHSQSFSPCFEKYIQTQGQIYQFYKKEYEADLNTYRERLLSPKKGDKTNWHNHIIEMALSLKYSSNSNETREPVEWGEETPTIDEIFDPYLEKEREHFIKGEQISSWMNLKNKLEPELIRLYHLVLENPATTDELAQTLSTIHRTTRVKQDELIVNLLKDMLSTTEGKELIKDYVVAKMMHERGINKENYENILDEEINKRVALFFESDDSSSLKKLVSFANYNLFVYKRNVEQTGISPLMYNDYFEKIKDLKCTLPSYNSTLDGNIPSILIDGQKRYFLDDHYIYSNQDVLQKLVKEQNENKLTPPTISQLLKPSLDLSVNTFFDSFALKEEANKVMDHYLEKEKYIKSYARLLYLTENKDITGTLVTKFGLEKNKVKDIERNLKNEKERLKAYGNSMYLTRSDIRRIEKMTGAEYTKLDFVLKRYSEELEQGILKIYKNILKNDIGNVETSLMKLSQLMSEKQDEAKIEKQIESVKGQLLANPDYNIVLMEYARCKADIYGLEKGLNPEEKSNYYRSIIKEITNEETFNKILGARIEEVARHYKKHGEDIVDIDMAHWHSVFKFATPMRWSVDSEGFLTKESLDVLQRYTKFVKTHLENEKEIQKSLTGYMANCDIDDESKKAYIDSAVERFEESKRRYEKFDNQFIFTPYDLYLMKQDCGISNPFPKYQLFGCLFRIANDLNKESNANERQAVIYKNKVARESARKRNLKAKEENDKRERR